MKKLDRELGLFAVFSISCGAMLGPGIFVLPGLAYKLGGPSVILAFIVAGLLVIPAALSKIEMSTALPESGGPYLFLDRSLGPLAGTLTGLGTWVSLILKSAFSLVGVGAYLMFFSGLPPEYVKHVAMGLGALLVLLNATGGKKAGQLQMILVVITIFVLLDFVGWGAIEVEKKHFDPFFSTGIGGFLATVAFVSVSYVGITKVVSVAEEIKEPERNIPWGILLSLFTTILIYVLVVYVVVGIVPEDKLGKGPLKLLPLAQAGGMLGGYWGKELLSGIAVVALASMANAGLMAASRFPLPMARDEILPSFLADVNDRFSTPLNSIMVTGVILLSFIYFFPVKQIAKLASGFLLLVFALVNLALIIFRESDIEWYQPSFESPAYPYLQILGTLASLGLIFCMGWVPAAGAGLLTAGSILWYYAYTQGQIDRVGAFFRTTADEEEIDIFERARSRSMSSKDSVIVPFFGLEDVNMLEVERRIRLASSLVDYDERLDIVDFVEVPEQSFLSGYDYDSEKYTELKERVELLRNDIESEIHVDQVITHSSRGALLNYAREENPHWVVSDWKEPSRWRILIGTQKWWLEDLPCDALFFEDNGITAFGDVTVVTEPGPYDGEVVYAAEHIAEYFAGDVTFLNPVDPDDADQLKFMESYQQELRDMTGDYASTELIDESEWETTIVERSTETDLILFGGRKQDTFFSDDELVNSSIQQQLECNYARVRSSLKSPKTVLSSERNDTLEIDDFLKNEGELLRVSPVDKEELFEEISNSLGDNKSMVERSKQSLWAREDIQNTYVDEGIAFPHAVFEDLDRTIFRIVIVDPPVDYTANNEEVSLCIATLGPPADREKHLTVLRRLARTVKNGAKENLLDARNYDEALDILLDTVE
ncbi:MAG: amino acid permease [bacterium]